MKKIFFTIAVTIGMTITLAASTNQPTKPDGNKKADKEVVKKVETSDTTATISAYPCPCSKFECSRCGGDVYWTAKAYKKYTGRNCQICDGKKCKECEWEGVEFFWQCGCKCSNCGNGFEQPDDC